MLLDQKLWVKASDIVCAKIVATGYKSNGMPILQNIKNKIFDGFAIVLNPVDHETTDPTCRIMLASGKILHLKEERLNIISRNSNNLISCA